MWDKQLTEIDFWLETREESSFYICEINANERKSEISSWKGGLQSDQILKSIVHVYPVNLMCETFKIFE